jgi:hypothetical protein
LEPRSHAFLVVDDEAEVPRTVRGLGSSRRKRDELVSHVDERHGGDTSAQFEVEETAVPGKRLVYVANLERNVVDADEPRHRTRP